MVSPIIVFPGSLVGISSPQAEHFAEAGKLLASYVILSVGRDFIPEVSTWNRPMRTKPLVAEGLRFDLANGEQQ
jgi:hypothetical protein